MKVLLLVNQYPPFATSAARLFHELALDLRGAGHEVAVVTAQPPMGKAAPDDEGIRVVRLRALPLPRDVPLLRALDHAWAGLGYPVASLRAMRPDVVLVYSPPLPLAATGIALARWTRAKAVVNVQDLYPKTAVDLELLKGRAAIRLAERLERYVYTHADALTVHSEGNREYVVRRGAPAERAHTILNWVDLERRADAARGRARLDELVGPRRFVAFYGGAMGYAQALDEVLDAADALRDHASICFLLVGDGVAREAMERRARDAGLANVVFVRTVPPSEYEELLAACDVALVTLRKELDSPVVPGKLQSIMAAGKPVLVATNPSSDAKAFVEDARCGVFVPAGEPGAMADALARMAKDPDELATMGRRGRAYAEARFARRDGTRAYETLFRRLQRQRA